jgi:dihydrolipoamide dehydrogenase
MNNAMSKIQTIVIPELGDFDGVPVIEILVSPGDKIDKETPLITLESDKATMDVPSSHAGTVSKILVSIGQEVKAGEAIVELDVVAEQTTGEAPAPADTATVDATSETPAGGPEQAASVSPETDEEYDADLVVIGSGPGGYTAAFRAADLGLKTILVERYSIIGGVCLNVGCIPSKALLHAAKVIEEAHDAESFGLNFGKPKIDIEKLLDWKSGIVNKLTGGLTQLAKQRKVTVVQGEASFASEHSIDVATDSNTQSIRFKHAIIAAGSRPVQIPGFPHDDPRLVDSTGALAMDDLPNSMLVIGGGIIGLEMATVYHALGCKISVVEMMDALIPGSDPDLVRPLQRKISKQYENIWLNTNVTGIEAQKQGLKVSFEGAKAPDTQTFDKVLVAVGRSPNGAKLKAQNAGIKVTERGFIEVDNQQRSNVPHIFAIGDLVGQPMLAHKAVHEGKVAAEVAAGLKSGFDARVIPSVAYTDPEIAWVGITETEAKAQKLNYGVGKFPWAASGRSLSLNRNEGVTKSLFDKDSNRLIGCGIVGPGAGDLIAEAALAIEMNADAEDIGLTIHPHPTLSETIGFSAEAFEGTITDLYIPKKK